MTRHLLHVGYPKAGSKFLQRWFEAHPQLAYWHGGIAGFRDVYAIARAGARGDAAARYHVTSYEGFAAPHAEGGQDTVEYRLEQESDPAAAQHRVCGLLASLFPGAVVLIITRGFRSMILSSYSQYVRSGGEADLAALIERTRSGGGPESPWDYDDLIGTYEHAFGAEHVIVMPYELLRDDPEEFIRVLATRLDIDAVAVARDRINESLSADEMYWYPRLTRLIRRIPSRRLFSLYASAAFHNRLRKPIGLLRRFRRGDPVTAALIPDDVVARFRGRAERLRANPLFAPYASEYLLD